MRKYPLWRQIHSNTKQSYARISQNLEDAPMETSAALLTESMNWSTWSQLKVLGRESAMVFGKTDSAPMEFDANSAIKKLNGTLKLLCWVWIVCSTMIASSVAQNSSGCCAIEPDYLYLLIFLNICMLFSFKNQAFFLRV